MSIGIYLAYDRVITLNLKASGLKQQVMRLLTAVGSNKIQENLMGLRSEPMKTIYWEITMSDITEVEKKVVC